MKNSFLILFCFIISTFCFGQGSANTKESYLKEGTPEISKGEPPIFGITGNEEITKYALLHTGLDSVKMYFGLGKGSDGQQYYWLVIRHCSGKTTDFISHFPLEPESGGFESFSLQYKWHKSPETISFKVMHHPESGTVKCVWFSGNGSIADGL